MTWSRGRADRVRAPSGGRAGALRCRTSAGRRTTGLWHVRSRRLTSLMPARPLDDRYPSISPTADFEGQMIGGGTADIVSAEQYADLATVLHETQLDRGLRTLLVTSATPREGKTLTVVNLAITLSELICAAGVDHRCGFAPAVRASSAWRRGGHGPERRAVASDERAPNHPRLAAALGAARRASRSEPARPFEPGPAPAGLRRNARHGSTGFWSTRLPWVSGQMPSFWRASSRA